ncbi:MBL fold metallo-hydrolase [Bacteroides faecichinchillae]|uniref:MBL fold metallo-hydrolase n=1 Tax=Bacteroides faecichinchillae TaxID=871325 RepID=UPI0035170A0B
MIRIVSIVNSIIASCTYIVLNDEQKEMWVIDCGDIKPILDNLPRDFQLKGVLLTHTHYDHCYGLNSLLQQYPDIKVYTNAYGREALESPQLNLSKYHEDLPEFRMEKIVNVTDVNRIHESNVEVIETPGHDPSCISFAIEKCLFTGDSYIPGCKLVCNFPHSNRKYARENEWLLRQYEQRGYKIYPGHWIGYCPLK